VPAVDEACAAVRDLTQGRVRFPTMDS